MRKKDFYKRNKSLILISVIFILFIVVGSCINKIDSSNLEDMSSQIGEIKSYYNGNISIKDFTITNWNIYFVVFYFSNIYNSIYSKSNFNRIYYKYKCFIIRTK